MTPLQQKESLETKETIKTLLAQRNHYSRLYHSALTHKAPDYAVNAAKRQLDLVQKQIDTELEYLEYLAQQIEDNLKEAV